MSRYLRSVLAGAMGLVWLQSAGATVTDFFNAGQVATSVSSGVTSETFSSEGYLFTVTRDKLFTGGGSVVIGRTVRVPWPSGVEAQSVTMPPPGVTDYKARLTVQRVDGGVFDLIGFTAKLLANTAATGAAIEIMPQLNGEDGFNDPVYFDASGYYGQSFSYNESPNVWGSTATLKGFDTYKVVLWVDFAFTDLVLATAGVTCAADADGSGTVTADDIFAFLDGWFAENGQTGAGWSADFNGDQLVSADDIFAFLDAWFAENGVCGV